MTIEKPSGAKDIRAAYEQTLIDKLRWSEGFPRKVFELLANRFKDWRYPSAEEIESAIEEIRSFVSAQPKLIGKDCIKIREKMGKTTEEMDTTIGIPK